MERKLDIARKIAIKKGIIKNPEDLQISKAKNKRFAIKYDGKTVNFGVWPYTGQGTFIDHQDPNIKKAWQARHSKIMKNGKQAYKDKTSPEYYSWNILW